MGTQKRQLQYSNDRRPPLVPESKTRVETSEQTHLTHPASKIHPQGIGSPPIQNLKRSKPLGQIGSPLYRTSSAANHYDQHGQQDNGTVDWTTKTQDKQERTPLTGG